MNPFALITIFSAAQASQKRRNNGVRTSAARRALSFSSRPNHDSPERQRDRSSLTVHVAVIIVLTIVVIAGLIVFAFAF